MAMAKMPAVHGHHSHGHHRGRLFAGAIACSASLFLYLLWQQTSGPVADTRKISMRERYRVPVELFVMSGCPDARFCEEAFARLLQNYTETTYVRAEYIATEDATGAVTCRHGDAECKGNRYQLCLESHIPKEKSYAWFLTTVLCLWESGQVLSLDALPPCMQKSGVSQEIQTEVLSCANTDEGLQLERQSAALVKARDVQRSCTVYIGGERRCIRDGGTWYDCPGGSTDADFTKTICEVFKNATGSHSSECSQPSIRKLSKAGHGK
jgi:hypothetical protein